MFKKNVFNTVFFIVLASFISSCNSDYTPKPRGYFRIDFPEKTYRVFDTLGYPYSFQYPYYAYISPNAGAKTEPYWINIDFPQYSGRVHISYKKINKNLAQYFEDVRSLVNKHIPKADAINEYSIYNKERKIFGAIYEIKGKAVASTYQFYITDSSKHFVRGALYFNITPNNDSLAPVIDFVKKDIDHMIDTWKWKK